LEILEDIICCLKIIFLATYKNDSILLKGSHQNLYKIFDKKSHQNNNENKFSSEEVILNHKNFLILDYFLDCFTLIKNSSEELNNEDILNSIFQIEIDPREFFTFLKIFYLKIIQSKTEKLFFKNNSELRFFEFGNKKIKNFVSKVLLILPNSDHDFLNNKNIIVSLLPDDCFSNFLHGKKIKIIEKNFDNLKTKILLYKKYLLGDFSDKEIYVCFQILYNNVLNLSKQNFFEIEKDLIELLTNLLKKSKTLFESIFLQVIKLINFFEKSFLNFESTQKLRFLILKIINDSSIILDKYICLDLINKILDFFQQKNDIDNCYQFLSFIQNLNDKEIKVIILNIYLKKKIDNSFKLIDFFILNRLIEFSEEKKEKLILCQFLFIKTSPNVLNEYLFLIQKKEFYSELNTLNKYLPILLNSLINKNEEKNFYFGMMLVLAFLEEQNSFLNKIISLILESLDLKKQKEFIQNLLKSNFGKEFAKVSLDAKYQIILEEQINSNVTINRSNRAKNPPKLMNLRNIKSQKK
jgi:hypothetical protein